VPVKELCPLTPFLELFIQMRAQHIKALVRVNVDKATKIEALRVLCFSLEFSSVMMAMT